MLPFVAVVGLPRAFAELLLMMLRMPSLPDLLLFLLLLLSAAGLVVKGLRDLGFGARWFYHSLFFVGVECPQVISLAIPVAL